MSMCCKEFGWQEISMEGVRSLSNAEVEEMLESIAWKKAQEEWGYEMEVKPKLILLKKITDLDEWSDCAGLRRRADRRMKIKLRGGAVAFQIETGRWWGVAREERVCKQCRSGEVKDVEHCLLGCAAWKTHRGPLLAIVQEHQEVDHDNLAAFLLSFACRNYKVCFVISYMWHARFSWGITINMSMVSFNTYVWLGVFVCFYLCLCICSHVLVLHWTNLGPSALGHGAP